MYLNLALFGDNFNISDVDINYVARNMGQSIRHELIHASHFEKRKTKQKISRLAAKSRFEREGEIPDSENRRKYLSSKIEIDAYAHQFAEEILSNYGKEEALSIIRGNIDFLNLDLSDEIKEYFIYFSNMRVLNRLRGKIYSNIISLTDRKIYEIDKKYSKVAYTKEAYEIGTSKNLFLDRPSTHGGWPEGEYEPPVMKRIENWLKKMKMIYED